MTTLYRSFILVILTICTTSAFAVSEYGEVEIMRDPKHPHFYSIDNLPLIPQTEEVADKLNEKFKDAHVMKTWCDLKYQPTAAGAVVYSIRICVNNTSDY